MTQKTFFIKTFGCQMNEADSEKIAAVMAKQGFKLADSLKEAKVVIINTCSVRESAENRVFGLVRNLTRQRLPGQKIILTGCMLGSALGERQRYGLGKLKKSLPGVDEFKTIEALLGEKAITPKRQRQNRALVPIMKGCDHFCSYCVVPFARGKERSRPFVEIVDEVKSLVKQGCPEVMLLGQNVNAYQPSFAKLVRKLHQITGLKKISFMTSNPWNWNKEMIAAIGLPKVNRILHLPVQSGDDKILARMNRPYTARKYLALVKKIRGQIPDIKISTDLIVGFPGESKKAFQNTVALCRKVGFVKAYISRYSPRPGTTAAKWQDDVSPQEKKQRWQILNQLINS